MRNLINSSLRFLSKTKRTNVLTSAVVLVSMLAVFTMFSFEQSANAESEEKPFEEQLWAYLIGNNYKNWSPSPGQDGDFYTGQSPHGALLKMYMNRTAACNIDGLKDGSIIILEDYRADRSLKTISVMYQTKGYNPAGNDWYWVAYHPDGRVVQERQQSSVSRDGEIQLASAEFSKIMGKADSCIQCHQNAGGTDLTFFNDGSGSNLAEAEENSSPFSQIR